MGKIVHEDLKKLYYTIGEVAEMFNVNTSLIRFWEKEFPAIQPKKNKKGNRLFTPKEIAKIEQIYLLVKTEGYTLEGAKKALKSKNNSIPAASESDNNEVLSRLEKVKEKLLSLKR